MSTFYLHINHHGPWELEWEDGKVVEDSCYLGLNKEQCENVIDTLYEVKIEIDPDTGRVDSVTFSDGQILRRPKD